MDLFGKISIAMNRARQYIFKQEQKWFAKFQPFLKGSVLKVGNGLGYSATFIAKTNPRLTIIDVHKDRRAINKADVLIYDGKNIPFADQAFDCAVCTYVLHHTPSPLAVLSELKRVAKRIIIIEETYGNIFAKFDLIYRDILVNFAARQRSKIHWKSYFKTGELESFFAKNELMMVTHIKERHRSYCKELFVLDQR